MKIIIIGSFNMPKNGSFGGVYYACTTLVRKLKTFEIDVIELDITLKDIKQTNVLLRFPSLIIRNILFLIKIMVNPKASRILTFVSAGNSYLDKLPSILLSKMFNKKIIIFPVSGLIVKDFEKLIYRRTVKTVLRMSDVIVCQSGYWREYFMLKGIREEKLMVIENWVTDETIEKSKQLYFRTFNEQEEPFRIIYVSRIELNKGIMDLLEAARILNGKIPYEINIYGDGKYVSNLNEIIKDPRFENKVKYHKWLDRSIMLDTINNCHLAVFPSKFEGYPNSVLDFIFSKIPVLSSNIPSVKAVGMEMMTYYDVGDSNDFAQKIIWCRDNYSLIQDKARLLLNEKMKKNNIDYASDHILEIIK